MPKNETTVLETSPFLRTPDAAEYLGLSPATLTTWRCRGGGPRFCRMGRAVRYRRADLDTFATSGRASSTSEVVGGV